MDSPEPTPAPAGPVEPLTCACCGPPIPATVLVLHSELQRIAVPMCQLRHAPGDKVRVVAIDSPEVRRALESYTIARGYLVPREPLPS